MGLHRDRDPVESKGLGAWAAEGASAATREKPVSPGTTSCAQGLTLGLSVSPSDPRFSQVSLQRLLPRRFLDGLRQTWGGAAWRFRVAGKGAGCIAFLDLHGVLERGAHRRRFLPGVAFGGVARKSRCGASGWVVQCPCRRTLGETSRNPHDGERWAPGGSQVTNPVQ